MRRIRHAAAVLATVPFVSAATASDVQTFRTEHYTVRVEQMAGKLDHPWSIAFLPDGDLLVTERRGRLYRLDGNNFRKTRIRGVPDVAASGQGGLLDVVVDPQFATNRTLFLSYSEAGSGGAGTAVARARLPAGAEPRLEEFSVVFRQQPKVGGGRHFGSRIVVARDDTLFVTLGERGQADEAQNLQTHLGKVVRINKDGSVPPDNPFVGRRDALPEIWSYGHRNAQGAALDPRTGRLWTLAHGARGGDEINLPQAGRNYGWPVVSFGTHYSGGRIGVGTAASGMEQPVYHWDPSIAPSGLAFYDGAMFPKWRGNLFAGALKFRLIARLELDGDRVVAEERILPDAYGRIRDVRQGPDGALWFLTDERDGGLYRIAPAQ